MTPSLPDARTRPAAERGADRGPPARSLDTPVPLGRDWYRRPVLVIARDLLGRHIVRGQPGGSSTWRIVEVEAYDGPADRASHARVGLTSRTAPMFGEVGHAYVYLVYGMHHCLNVVAHVGESAGAVLIRALEPIADDRPGMPYAARSAAGPGLVGRMLGLDRSLSGHDLTTGERLWLETGTGVPDDRVLRGPRIGVAYAGPDWAELPWRLGVRGSSALSRPFPADPRSAATARG